MFDFTLLSQFDIKTFLAVMAPIGTVGAYVFGKRKRNLDLDKTSAEIEKTNHEIVNAELENVGVALELYRKMFKDLENEAEKFKSDLSAARLHGLKVESLLKREYDKNNRLHEENVFLVKKIKAWENGCLSTNPECPIIQSIKQIKK